VPREYIPSVEKGVSKATDGGVIAASQTHGQGTFTMAAARLAPVPDHLAGRIVEAHEKEAVAV
jgi:translation elongation factor EF-G